MSALRSARRYSGNIDATSDQEKSIGEVVDGIAPNATVSYTGHLMEAGVKTGKYYFQDDSINVIFTVDEANFFAEDVTVKLKTNDGDFVEKDLVWSSNGDTRTAILPLAQANSYYQYSIEYKDKSDNNMNITDSTTNSSGTFSYTSPVIVLDTIAPVIQVSYSGSSRNTNGKPYYNGTATATVKIIETNFFADDVKFEFTSKNIDGAAVSGESVGSWTRDGDVNTCVITYANDANYTFDMSYIDLANNAAAAYPQDTFTVEKTPPTNLGIGYSVDVLGAVTGTILWYDAPVNVTLTATDVTAGIETINYSYETNAGVSTVNVGESNISVSVNANNSSVEHQFSIPSSALTETNQFDGHVSFTATDRSGNESSTTAASEPEVIVDNIAPVINVEYNETTDPFVDGKTESGEDASDADYYNVAVQVDVEIDEANFDANDVTIQVTKDDAEYNGFSYHFTDVSVDEHITDFTLSETGEYVITISYTDKSTNEMVAGDRIDNDVTDGVYVSRVKVVDVDKPEITFNFNGEEALDKTAHDEDIIEHIVSVHDDHILPEGIDVKLTGFERGADAMDINTYHYVDETKTYVKEPSEITEDEDYNVVVSDIGADAVYLLSCEATDRAGNSDKQELMFSVNRDGSTYYLSDETGKLIEKFYTNTTQGVEIHEISVEALTEMNVTVIRDASTSALEENTEYQVVDRSGEDNNWYDYQYTVNQENFEKEGAYTVQTSSKTEGTGKKYSNSNDDNAVVQFAMDTTLPEVFISGVTADVTKYKTNAQPITVTVSDNMRLDHATLIINGEEQPIEITDGVSGTLQTTITASNDDQTVQVLASDAATNTYQLSEPITIRVTSNVISLYREYFIAGGVVLLFVVGAPITVVVSRKKRKTKV